MLGLEASPRGVLRMLRGEKEVVEALNLRRSEDGSWSELRGELGP